MLDITLSLQNLLDLYFYFDSTPAGKLLIVAGMTLMAVVGYVSVSPSTGEGGDDKNNKKEGDDEDEEPESNFILSEQAAVYLFFVAVFSLTLGGFFVFSHGFADVEPPLNYNFAHMTFAEELLLAPAPLSPEAIALNDSLLRQTFIWLEKPLSILEPITHPALEHKGWDLYIQMTYNMCKCDFNESEMLAFKAAIQAQAIEDLKKNPQLVVGVFGDDRFDPRALFKHILSFVGTWDLNSFKEGAGSV